MRLAAYVCLASAGGDLAGTYGADMVTCKAAIDGSSYPVQATVDGTLKLQVRV